MRNEITRKFGACLATLKKLDLFWNNNNCQKNRLQVFDAVIRSKLVYGLESVMLTKSLLNKLDVLELKGLRKILGFKTTFVERANTNQIVYDSANSFKNPGHKPDKKDIKKFSTYVKTQQHKLLAHTIRAEQQDPVRQATLQPESDLPVEVGTRRVGRPRKNCTWSNYAELYVSNNLGTLEQFKDDPRDGIERVAQKARNISIVC